MTDHTGDSEGAKRNVRLVHAQRGKSACFGGLARNRGRGVAMGVRTTMTAGWGRTSPDAMAANILLVDGNAGGLNLAAAVLKNHRLKMSADAGLAIRTRGGVISARGPIGHKV